MTGKKRLNSVRRRLVKTFWEGHQGQERMYSDKREQEDYEPCNVEMTGYDGRRILISRTRKHTSYYIKLKFPFFVIPVYTEIIIWIYSQGRKSAFKLIEE